MEKIKFKGFQKSLELYSITFDTSIQYWSKLKIEKYQFIRLKNNLFKQIEQRIIKLYLKN